MRELLLREASGATDAEAARLQVLVAQLRVRGGALQTRFERLAEALSDGTLSKDEFRHINAKIKAEREEVPERLQVGEIALENRQGHQDWVQRVQEAVLNLPLVWEHLNGDERHELLSLVLETLTVDRQGRDACVKIKVRLMPERQVPIMFKTAKMKQKPTCLAALTPRHLAILHHAGHGKTRAQIAQAMNISYSSANTLVSHILSILEVREREVLRACSWCGSRRGMRQPWNQPTDQLESMLKRRWEPPEQPRQPNPSLGSLAHNLQN